MRSPTAGRCPDCGTPTTELGVTCEDRFDELLALDHSRRAPWGPRHGLAFAVYALQHPSRFDRSIRERSWQILYRAYRLGEDLVRITTSIRRDPGRRPHPLAVPALPDRPEGDTFPVTIAALGSFDAARYPEDLDTWCRSTLAAFGAGRPPTGGRDAARTVE